MKKVFSILIVCMLVISLSACGDIGFSLGGSIPQVTLPDFTYPANPTMGGSSQTTPPVNDDNKPSDSNSDDNSIDPTFKKAMDDYEAFMDEYVSFMKKYSADPSDLSLMADYATFMLKYAQFVDDFEAWEDEELNTAELAYYLQVQARVSEKLRDIVE